jgi:hypothetical protein
MTCRKPRPQSRLHDHWSRWSGFLVGTIAIAVAAAGCSSEKFRTSEVTGTVTYKGKPAPGLMLQFTPPNGDKLGLPPAYGVTQSDGSYRLARPGSKWGAVVGRNVVTVSVMPQDKPSAVMIPEKDVKDRSFDVEVSAKPNVHDIAL